MLLSPGTVISDSIRGARLMRNSMSDGQHRENSPACPARRCFGREVAPRRPNRRPKFADAPRAVPTSRSGNEEDFLRVGVLDLGARRETADIDVTGIRR